MKISKILSTLVLVSAALPLCAMAQSRDLQQLDALDLSTWNAPLEFRIASFEANEDAKGNGSMLLAVSQDGKKARIKLAGVMTELSAMPAAMDITCNNEGTRQTIFAYQQIRLLVKLSFSRSTKSCIAQGVVSIKTAQHTNRYLVKSTW